MANPEHSEILTSGVGAWNKWRERQREVRPDLAQAQLKGLELSGAALYKADLSGANLVGSSLRGANLVGANLEKARLTGGDLSKAQLGKARLQDALLTETVLDRASFDFAVLVGASLAKASCVETAFTGADLRGADLRAARLFETDFSGANLQEVSFQQSYFFKANLAGADFSKAVFAETGLQGLALGEASGLEETQHLGPSSISLDTIALSPGLPESFLRGVGLPDHLLAYARNLAPPSLEYYSAFISYNHSDQAFARRLHDQLQAQGIRCWLDQRELKPGDLIFTAIEDAIRLHDKILLCCSRSSLDSWWVKDEIRKAQERERKEGRSIIIPMNLDGYLFEWPDGLASDLTSRLAADFTGWAEDDAKFEAEFERVVEALRA